MNVIAVTEDREFELSESRAQRLRDAVERLTGQLKPRLPFLRDGRSGLRLSNLVGTIDIGEGDLIEVSPKTPVQTDWAAAVVSLLTGDESIEVAGERPAGVSHLHNRLLNGIAVAFLTRLERAYRQEGPIVLQRRVSRELLHLQGTLKVTSWVQKALWRPHVFPVSRVEFAHENPFSYGLIRVADSLANVAVDANVRAKLKFLARNLSPGLAAKRFNPLEVASRELPQQWNAYKPAWSLAVAVLTKTSLFGPRGQHAGIGVAVEAWPLLETLLERTLQSAVRIAKGRGRMLVPQMRSKVLLLDPDTRSEQHRFSPEADGRLSEQEKTVATFEAKYSTFDPMSLKREHIYQALAAAAAWQSPIAVLVYPEKFKPYCWRVNGFNCKPLRLVTIGLDMFALYPPNRKESRGEALLHELTKADSNTYPDSQRESAA